MLVLTRRRGEEIVVDGKIVITVIAVKGGAVRLGITAPPTVPVQRREIQREYNTFTNDAPSTPPAADSRRF